MDITGNDLEQIIHEFIDFPVEDIGPLGNGHINTSLFINAGDSYVLQKLNRDLFADHLKHLENNYLRYKFCCVSAPDAAGWICPDMMKTREGGFFHICDDGIWRMYRYVRSDRISRDEPDPYVIGVGIGKLHRILKKSSPGNFSAVIPHLHDLGYYYDRYLMQKDSDRARQPDLDEMIADNIGHFMNMIIPEGDVIHGDIKPDNMIFRDGKVVGFIDLDTMMPGSVFNDIADGMRYCCETEDHVFNPAKAGSLLNGYCDGADAEMTDEAIELLGHTYYRNRFMLGLRYYTDHLAGNVYFTENYPGQSLEKARRLIVM